MEWIQIELSKAYSWDGGICICGENTQHLVATVSKIVSRQKHKLARHTDHGNINKLGAFLENIACALWAAIEQGRISHRCDEIVVTVTIPNCVVNMNMLGAATILFEIVKYDSDGAFQWTAHWMATRETQKTEYLWHDCAIMLDTCELCRWDALNRDTTS